MSLWVSRKFVELIFFTGGKLLLQFCVKFTLTISVKIFCGAVAL